MGDEGRRRTWPAGRELPAILPPGAMPHVSENEETIALMQCCRVLGDLPTPIARRITIYLMQRFGREPEMYETGSTR